MRLILIWLSIANMRWAASEVERSVWLDREAEKAMLRAANLMALANQQAERAGVGTRTA